MRSETMKRKSLLFLADLSWGKILKNLLISDSKEAESARQYSVSCFCGWQQDGIVCELLSCWFSVSFAALGLKRLAGGVPEMFHVMLACKVKLQHKSLAAQGVRLNTADLMHSTGGHLEECASPLRNLCCKPVVEPDGERAGKLQLQTGLVKLY